MYTERKISLQYAQPFSGLSWMKKNNFIKNLERASGEGGLKIYDSTLNFFDFAVILGWVGGSRPSQSKTVILCVSSF